MLKELFDKYLCDKGTKHNYQQVYEPDFEPLKDKQINILEIGVYKGASTCALVEYFPKAKLYSVDIYERVDMNQITILKHNRVKTIKGSSMDPSVVDKMKEEWGKNIKFDIIIDDGMHTPKANRLTFELMFPMLKKSGIYYVEDAWPLDIMTQEERNHRWLTDKPIDYNDTQMELFLDTINKYNVTRHDNRKGNAADSYIFKITK
jgi:predicted O-methyltransferase YrrM